MRGYTRFTRDHGDAAASALAGRFADLVRDAVPEFEGELLELRGDEALCVFSSARQALRASVEIQRRMRTADDRCAGPLPLGVGMGMDAGEALPTQGGYRGDALNLAARLCAMAGPGQTLASETVMALSRRVDGLHFSAPRQVRLKGMQDPVRIVEVVSDEPLPAIPRLASPVRRRRWPIAVATTVAIVIAAVLAGVLTRSSAHAVSLKPGRVAEIDPGSFSVKHAIPISEPPAAMASGSGSVWAAESNAGRVERIYPGGGALPIKVGSEPSALTFAFGQLWVADTGDGTVTRVNAENQALSPIAVGNGPSAVVATGDRVWVANRLDDTIVRLDPTGKVVGNPIRLGSPPSGLAAAGGSVWVAEADAGQVVQVNARTGQPTNAVPVENGPAAITAGDGRLFSANGDGTVTAIDPGTGHIEWTTSVGGNPSGIAFAKGAVWVTDTTTGHLTELSTSGRPLHVLVVQAHTGAISSDGESLWISTLPSASVHRGGTLIGLVGGGYLASQSPDPALETDGLNAAMVSLSNDGLLAFRKVSGSAGYQVIADLARAVPQPTDGGLTYTFQLRKGIRYSNGDGLGPADVRWSFERFYMSNPGGPLVGGDIVGSSRCVSQTLKPVKRCDLTRGIISDPGSGTVTFHLTQPDPDFLGKLAGFQAIVPVGTRPGLTQGHMVPGTGPYVPVKLRRHARRKAPGAGRNRLCAEPPLPCLVTRRTARGLPRPDRVQGYELGGR